VFRRAIQALNEAEIPFVIAGAFAVHYYTGLWRFTKDLDLFLKPASALPALDCLRVAGFTTDIEEAHWLAKARLGHSFCDLIWGGGNWATFVDEDWFQYSVPAQLLGEPVKMAPIEELILSKAYVMGRERFDGADIAHLLRAGDGRIDWERMILRFGPHWELLLSHLLAYRFVYADHRDIVPLEVLQGLMRRVGTPEEIADGLPFRGPLVDRYSYLHDLVEQGMPDPRDTLAASHGLPMSAVRYRREADRAAVAAQRVPQHRGIARSDDREERPFRQNGHEHDHGLDEVPPPDSSRH
jgi:hypothetical protein